MIQTHVYNESYWKTIKVYLADKDHFEQDHTDNDKDNSESKTIKKTFINFNKTLPYKTFVATSISTRDLHSLAVIRILLNRFINSSPNLTNSLGPINILE